MSDSEDDDFIAQQAAMAAAKYGVQKKTAIISDDKKKFDSADYYQKQAQVMKAAGMEVEGEEAKEMDDS